MPLSRRRLTPPLPSDQKHAILSLSNSKNKNIVSCENEDSLDNNICKLCFRTHCDTPPGALWQEEKTSTVSCLVKSMRMAADTKADPRGTGGFESSAEGLSSVS